jgi:hypothetical protein
MSQKKKKNSLLLSYVPDGYSLICSHYIMHICYHLFLLDEGNPEQLSLSMDGIFKAQETFKNVYSSGPPKIHKFQLLFSQVLCKI